jgi:Phage integrase, N-terminal SAM-like domain
MTSMSELRERMIADMTSAGLAASTKAVYIQGVRALAAYYRRSPDQLSEGEVRSYLLHLRDERGAARGTFQPHHGGIRFLFAHTLDRDWSLFSKKEFARPSASVCPTSCRTPRLARSLAA